MTLQLNLSNLQQYILVRIKYTNPPLLGTSFVVALLNLCDCIGRYIESFQKKFAEQVRLFSSCAYMYVIPLTPKCFWRSMQASPTYGNLILYNMSRDCDVTFL